MLPRFKREVKAEQKIHGISTSKATANIYMVFSSKMEGFPRGLDGKESACNAGDPGSIPGSGRDPGERNGDPLQYSYLENSTDRGVWQAAVHAVPELDSTKQLSLHFTSLHFIGGSGNIDSFNSHDKSLRQVLILFNL